VRERIVTFVSESRLPCERFSLQRSVQRLCFRTLARVATTITSLTEPQPCRRLERSGSGAHPVATKHFCLAAFTTGSEKVMRSGGGLGESAMGRIHGSFTYTGSSQQVGSCEPQESSRGWYTPSSANSWCGSDGNTTTQPPACLCGSNCRFQEFSISAEHGSPLTMMTSPGDSLRVNLCVGRGASL
jgi:hypothetical protein